jgi:hypothetical protein
MSQEWQGSPTILWYNVCFCSILIIITARTILSDTLKTDYTFHACVCGYIQFFVSCYIFLESPARFFLEMAIDVPCFGTTSRKRQLLRVFFLFLLLDYCYSYDNSSYYLLVTCGHCCCCCFGCLFLCRLLNNSLSTFLQGRQHHIF